MTRKAGEEVWGVWWERKASAWERAKGVVQGSESFANASAERRTVGSIVPCEDGVRGWTAWRRLRERRPRVPVCLARKPERMRCFEERAGRG